MLPTFGLLQASFGKKVNEPFAEGFCNKLHYQVSVVFLFGCCLLVTCLEWIGNGSKISCLMMGSPDSWAIPNNVINTYCYIMTTFTIPKHWNSRIGEESVNIGVGNYNSDVDVVSHKAYYQWVPFVLFLQGLLFYMPHLLFKMWEGGKVKNVISGLNQLILDKRERATKERILADYCVDSLNTHNVWALKMLFVEFLNLINVVGNIYFVDVFLGGEFTTYGIKVVNFLEADPEKRVDPMAMVFPRVTKCTFRKYGPSGSIQIHDAMCVLPINIINEKIYVFLWFWFLLLTVVTVIGIIHHVATMLMPSLIQGYLSYHTLHKKNIDFDEIGAHLEVGDWKLLHILSKNMEPLVFGEFLRELGETIRARREVKAVRAMESVDV